MFQLLHKLAFQLIVGAAITLLFANLAAAECDITIVASDAMQFDKKTIEVSKSCTKVTLKLKHSGALAKEIMGHNWVLMKGTDVMSFSQEMSAAGMDKQFVVEGDPRLIAYTEVIGGGEETSIEFDISKLDASETYQYVCTFPGHYALMKGEFKIV